MRWCWGICQALCHETYFKKTPTWPNFQLQINAWSMCKRNSFHHIFWCKSGRNGQCSWWLGGLLCKVKDHAWTRSSHDFVLVSCNKIAYKLTSEDREFLQLHFDKSLTKEIDTKSIKYFSYVSCIYNTFWWVGIVTEVNIHESDLKIEFLHPHGPRKTFSWPSVADKCFVPALNILGIITAPTTITGRIYQIWDTDFEQSFKAYENHKM